MDWIYYLMGATILGAYGLVWYLRVRRARNVARYTQTLQRAPHPDEAGYTPGLPPDITRDMVQNCTGSAGAAETAGLKDTTMTGCAADGERDRTVPDGTEKEQ